jgi:hypothetical protein
LLAAANSLLAVYGNNTQPGKGSNVYDAIEPIEVSDEYREACHKMRDRRVYHPKETVDIEDFWRVHNGGGSYGVLAGRRTPSGTLWADQVRLDACLELREPPEQDQSVDWTWPDAIKRFVKRWLGMD